MPHSWIFHMTKKWKQPQKWRQIGLLFRPKKWRQPYIWKTTFDKRRPLMADNLLLKTSFDGKLILMEDNLWWKTNFYGRWTFDGRQTLMEEDHWWGTTFDGRQPLMEDYFWWKTPSMEDDCQWKIAFSARQLGDKLQSFWSLTQKNKSWYKYKCYRIAIFIIKI